MSGSMLSKPGQNKEFIGRIVILGGGFCLCMFILLIMVSYIQILKNPEFTKQTKNNREKSVRVPPIRGKVFSSDGKVLIDNKKIFSVYINVNELSNDYQVRQESLLYLAEVLNYNYSDIEKIIASKAKSREDILIADNINFEKFIKIHENSENMPGIITKGRDIRYYPNNSTLSHVLGYVGPINSEEYNLKRQNGYEQNDIIGKTGIESFYEDDLRGKDGRKFYIVDARMVVQNELKHKEIIPQAGNEIVLSVDLELQKNVEDILSDRIGTVLVMRPHNGELLAMTSYPNFDPNIYILETEENFEKKRQIELEVKETPLYNRNIQTLYPAASLFKMITATAIINEGLVSLDKQYYCGGSYRLNNQVFGCWIRHSSGGHGFLNLKEAIINSCDVYFYNVAKIVGIEKISEYAFMYGFGSPLGIDLPFEKGGLIPTLQWKKEQHQTWHLGDTLNSIIGQGDVKITPLQLANMMAAICNKGVAYRPHFLKEIRSSDTGEILKTYPMEKVVDMKDIPKYVFDILEDQLRATVSVGTAKWAFWGNPYKMVGKTGTAEYGFGQKKNTHSLFAGYGPIESPVEERIVIMILIENDNNEFLKYAARLANLVANSWLRKENFEQSAKRFGFPIQESYR